MSKIKQELIKATGIEAKRGEGEEDHMVRVLVGVAKLSDPEWAKISKPAQSWYNDAADARNEKPPKALPAFPDAEEPKAAGRRKVQDEPEERLTKVGDTATVVTNRGKEYTGEVVEISDDIIVLRGDDGDDEFDMAKVKSVTVLNGDAGGGETSWEPAVGDVVELTTKRGKTYTGQIVEIDDKIVVLKGDDGEDEFDMDKVGDIVRLGGAKEDDAPARRQAAKDDAPARRGAEKEAPADGKPKRASNPRGVSVGGRIRELMCDDMAITTAEIAKVLKKEGIEFREPTLDMIFKDTQTVFELLKAGKKLK